MKIDWGNIVPSEELRDAVERSMEPLADVAGERFSIRRENDLYKLQVRAMWLEGDDIVELAARAAGVVRTLRGSFT